MDGMGDIDIFTQKVWKLSIIITAMKLGPPDLIAKLEEDFLLIMNDLSDLMKNNSGTIERSVWEDLFIFLCSLEEASSVVKESMFDGRVVGAACNDVFDFICKNQMKLSHFTLYFLNNSEYSQDELKNVQDKLEYNLNKYLRMSQISKKTSEYTAKLLEKYIEDLNSILDTIKNLQKETQKFSDIMGEINLEESGDEA